MHRTLIGLLAAVSAAASALIGVTHGDMIPLAVGGAAVAAGVSVYLAAPSKKNSLAVNSSLTAEESSAGLPVPEGIFGRSRSVLSAAAGSDPPPRIFRRRGRHDLILRPTCPR